MLVDIYNNVEAAISHCPLNLSFIVSNTQRSFEDNITGPHTQGPRSSSPSQSTQTRLYHDRLQLDEVRCD